MVSAGGSRWLTLRATASAPVTLGSGYASKGPTGVPEAAALRPLPLPLPRPLALPLPLPLPLPAPCWAKGVSEPPSEPSSSEPSTLLLSSLDDASSSSDRDLEEPSDTDLELALPLPLPRPLPLLRPPVLLPALSPLLLPAPLALPLPLPLPLPGGLPLLLGIAETRSVPGPGSRAALLPWMGTWLAGLGAAVSGWLDLAANLCGGSVAPFTGICPPKATFPCSKAARVKPKYQQAD